MIRLTSVCIKSVLKSALTDLSIGQPGGGFDRPIFLLTLSFDHIFKRIKTCNSNKWVSGKVVGVIVDGRFIL